MKDQDKRLLLKAGVLTGLIATSFLAGCVVEPEDGYYDRDHHRYYHEHGWRDCRGDDEHCRGDRGRYRDRD